MVEFGMTKCDQLPSSASGLKADLLGTSVSGESLGQMKSCLENSLCGMEKM